MAATTTTTPATPTPVPAAYDPNLGYDLNWRQYAPADGSTPLDYRYYLGKNNGDPKAATAEWEAKAAEERMRMMEANRLAGRSVNAGQDHTAYAPLTALQQGRDNSYLAGLVGRGAELNAQIRNMQENPPDTIYDPTTNPFDDRTLARSSTGRGQTITAPGSEATTATTPPPLVDGAMPVRFNRTTGAFEPNPDYKGATTTTTGAGNSGLINGALGTNDAATAANTANTPANAAANTAASGAAAAAIPTTLPDPAKFDPTAFINGQGGGALKPDSNLVNTVRTNLGTGVVGPNGEISYSQPLQQITALNGATAADIVGQTWGDNGDASKHFNPDNDIALGALREASNVVASTTIANPSNQALSGKKTSDVIEGVAFDEAARVAKAAGGVVQKVGNAYLLADGTLLVPPSHYNTQSSDSSNFVMYHTKPGVDWRSLVDTSNGGMNIVGLDINNGKVFIGTEKDDGLGQFSAIGSAIYGAIPEPLRTAQGQALSAPARLDEDVMHRLGAENGFIGNAMGYRSTTDAMLGNGEYFDSTQRGQALAPYEDVITPVAQGGSAIPFIGPLIGLVGGNQLDSINSATRGQDTDYEGSLFGRGTVSSIGSVAGSAAGNAAAGALGTTGMGTTAVTYGGRVIGNIATQAVTNGGSVNLVQALASGLNLTGNAFVDSALRQLIVNGKVDPVAAAMSILKTDSQKPVSELDDNSREVLQQIANSGGQQNGNA